MTWFVAFPMQVEIKYRVNTFPRRIVQRKKIPLFVLFNGQMGYGASPSMEWTEGWQLLHEDQEGK